MYQFVNAMDQCLLHRNWYGALFIALSLPDICGKLAYPQEVSSGKRYADWFKKYVQPAYTSMTDDQHTKTVFLSGEDCYALRCAFLHKGENDMTAQRCRQALDSFIFVDPPPPSAIYHFNQFFGKLQLQVDLFCKDIAGGVMEWLNDVKNNADIQNGLNTLMQIQTRDDDGRISL